MAKEETVHRGDFIEIAFTGKVTDTGAVFDTTEKDIAEANELNYRPEELGRKIICLGENHILPGLEQALESSTIGNEKTILLAPDQAFGKKDASLMRLVSTNHFRKEGIRPEPGMQVSIDGTLGIVKTISGARTLVDMNNPLAGREVSYEITIIRRVLDPALQAAWTINNEFGFLPRVEARKDPQKDPKGELIIHVPPKFPPELRKTVTERVQKLIPQVSSITVDESDEKTNNKV
ncbi:MAG: hypothetical protein GXP63_00365 [DPANN group archaeon]|nr:hypothetical protein [DPANN group archaeon]